MAKANAAASKNSQTGILEKLQKWFYRNRYYFLAFFLPVVLIYIAYALFGIYPFGDYSVLCLDLNGQYIYYFEAIRDAFHGDGSILYNWSRNLSGGYQGVIGYYLASPFTLLVVLLPRKMILGAMLIMILSKLGAASVTFSYYVQKSKNLSPMLSVILGTMFGMCAYGIIQTIDPMWLDGLVFLPLIALGIEYLIDDGRKINFIVPLALICIANFYIGFMCCIFSAIYFVFYICFCADKQSSKCRSVMLIGFVVLFSTVLSFYYFYKVKNAENVNEKLLSSYKGLLIISALLLIAFAVFLVYYYFFKIERKERADFDRFFMTFLRMAMASVVAICLAAFMILPVYNALALGKFDFTTPDYSYKSQFTIFEFIAQFTCVDQYSSVNVQGKPEIFCGVLAAICMPLFFLNPRIRVRKRLGYGFLTVVMFFCMMVRPIDMLWHGGQMPNWLPFRYSFIFSFIMLSMAAMSLKYITSIKPAHIYATFGGFFVFLLVIARYANLGAEELINNHNSFLVNQKGESYLLQSFTIGGTTYENVFPSVGVTIIFLAIYCGLLLMLRKKNLPKKTGLLVMLGLLAGVSFEMTYNAKTEFDDIHHEVAYSTRKSYVAYLESGRELVNKLYDTDSTFYRAEKTYVRTVNDNAGFQLRGITHSSSVMNTQILKFIEAMGYSCRSYYSRYDGNTPLADSLLGIKYVLHKGDDNENVLLEEELKDRIEVIDAAAEQRGTTTLITTTTTEETTLAEGEITEEVAETTTTTTKSVSGDPFEPSALLDIAYKKKFTEVCKSQSETDMDVTVYENPNALSLGYMVNKDILRVNAFGNDNPFKSQNILMSTITGNTTFTVNGDFDNWKKYYYEIPLLQEMRLNEVYTTDYNGQTNYREIRTADGGHAVDPTVDIFFEAQSDDPIYLFFQTRNESRVNLWLADQWNLVDTSMKNLDGSDASSLGTYFEGDDYRILYVGTFKKGTKLQLRMTLTTNAASVDNEKYTIINQFYITHFDTAMFQEDINQLKAQQWNLTKFGGRTLEGTITAKDGQIMMTSIPWEPGWTVWVDGKKLSEDQVLNVAQAMIGLELSAGEHTIKMRYTSPGLKLGIFLLLLGCTVSVLFCLYDRKHNETLKRILANRAKGIYEIPFDEEPEIDVKTVTPNRKSGGKEKDSGSAINTVLIADELKKLKELRDEGILTQEEFEQQKKKLLNR